MMAQNERACCWASGFPGRPQATSRSAIPVFTENATALACEQKRGAGLQATHSG